MGEQAMKASSDDARDALAEQLGLRDAMRAELRQMIYKTDLDGSGVVARDAIEELSKDLNFQTLLKKFEVEASDLIAFFDLVCDHNRILPLTDIDAFIRGCFRLKGVAKNIDIVAVLYRQ